MNTNADCPIGQVINPKTMRCITIGLDRYNELVAQGVLDQSRAHSGLHEVSDALRKLVPMMEAAKETFKQLDTTLRMTTKALVNASKEVKSHTNVKTTSPVKTKTPTPAKSKTPNAATKTKTPNAAAPNARNSSVLVYETHRKNGDGEDRIELPQDKLSSVDYVIVDISHTRSLITYGTEWVHKQFSMIPKIRVVAVYDMFSSKSPNTTRNTFKEDHVHTFDQKDRELSLDICKRMRNKTGYSFILLDVKQCNPKPTVGLVESGLRRVDFVERSCFKRGAASIMCYKDDKHGIIRVDKYDC